MGDPVSAGVVGSVVAPSATAAIANPITASLATGMGGGSLFGFDPSLGGIGQGVMEAFGKTPILGQGGMLSNVGQAAGAYNAFNQMMHPQQRMQGIGAGIQRGGQIQPVDYMSLLNPQQQTVIRPATPSLI